MPLDGTMPGTVPTQDSNRRQSRQRHPVRSRTRAATYSMETERRSNARQEPSGELIPSGLRKPIKLASGEEHRKEKERAAIVTGHAPGSRMPGGTMYYACGPQAANEMPVPAPTTAPQPAHHPH